MADNLSAICDTTDALYRAELTRFQGIAAEERRARDALARLDLPPPDPATPEALAMRTVGADVAWARWVGRQRSVLNMQLANILARKQEQLTRLQSAFGRNEAALSLRREAAAEAATRRQAKAAEVLQSLMLNAARPDP